MNQPAARLPLGSSLPSIPLLGSDGNMFDFSILKSKWVFIYFYPKAMTSGCTVQSIAMNRLQSTTPPGLVQVIGVSPDKPNSNHKFCVKEDLHIPLLSDTDHALAMAFGVWVEKSMYGRKYMGMKRSTFVFDAQRQLHAVFEQPNTSEQIAAVEAFYASLKAQAA